MSLMKNSTSFYIPLAIFENISKIDAEMIESVNLNWIKIHSLIR